MWATKVDLERKIEYNEITMLQIIEQRITKHGAAL